MGKRKLLVMTFGLTSIMAVAAAVTLNSSNLDYIAFADESHTSSCVFNHYDAVMPTSTTHGSKEFWACCSAHHGFLLDEPDYGTIHDAGAFSGYYFDNLDPEDARYLAPISGGYSATVNDSDIHIPFVDVSESKEPGELWEKQWKLTLSDIERGDRLTIYAGDLVLEVDATKTYDEYNDNNVALKNNDGTGNKLYVVAAAESSDLYLKYMPNGTYDLWLTGYNYSYDAFIRYTMGPNYDWIDKDMLVYGIQGEFDGSGPQASTVVELGDLSRYVIYRGFEWINGVDMGSVHWKAEYWWTQYYAKRHTYNQEYYLVMEKAGRYLIEAQGTAHAIDWENYLNILPVEFTLSINGVPVTDEHRCESGVGYDFLGLEMHQNDSIYFYNRLNDHNGFPIFIYGEHNNYYGPVDGYPSNDFIIYREGIYDYYGQFDMYYTFTLEPVLIDTYWKMYLNDELLDTELNFENKDEFMVKDLYLEAGDELYFQTSEEGHDDVLNYNNFSEYQGNDSYLFEKGANNKIVAKHSGTYSFYVAYKEDKGIWVDANQNYVALVNDVSTPMMVNAENPNEVTLLDVELFKDDEVVFFDGYEKYFNYDNLKIENGNAITYFSRGDDGELVVLEDGVYSFYLDVVYDRGIWVIKDNDPSLGNIIYNINSLPDWTFTNATVFVWTWSSTNSGEWVEVMPLSDTTLAFIVEEDIEHFLIVRCYEGTKTPNWDETGDKPGRIYNKTSNYNTPKGVYTHSVGYFYDYPD